MTPSESYHDLLKTDRDARRLKALAGMELSELLQPLDAHSRDNVIDLFVSEILRGTDQCDGCYGKSSRQCQKCRNNSGRMSKDFRLTTLMKRIADLEWYSQQLAENALFGGPAPRSDLNLK
jgi:hypothetical protein